LKWCSTSSFKTWGEEGGKLRVDHARLAECEKSQKSDLWVGLELHNPILSKLTKRQKNQLKQGTISSWIERESHVRNWAVTKAIIKDVAKLISLFNSKNVRILGTYNW
jgi:hypothetical protein